MTHQSSSFQLASLFSRIAAFTIDLIILIMAVAAVAIITALTPVLGEIWVGSTTHKILIAKSLAPILYLFINGYQLAHYGQTIGKNLMGLVTVSVNGHLPDNIQHFYRSIFIFAIIWLPLTYILIIIAIQAVYVTISGNKGLHDKIAKTKVVEVIDTV